MTKHAKWSPSGSPRWLKCSASVTLGPGEYSSSAAAERGTLLHGEAADALLGDEGPGIDNQDVVDYIEFVRERQDDFTLRVFIETPVPLLPVTGESAHGSVDCLVLQPNLLEVIDLKTGAMAVEPSSSQLKLYGAAACYEVDYDGPVHLIIHQGGKAHVHETHSEDLLTFAADVRRYIDNAEADARKGLHSYNPSEDACRYCPHVATCPELREFRDALAADDFLVVEDPTDLANDLDMIPPLLAWAKATQEKAQALALKGVTLPGYKLVRANTMRKWIGEKELVAVLGEAAYDRKLIGIGAGEKLLDAKTMQELTIKPEGGPVLVPETDKRPAIADDAATDFLNVTTE